MKRLYAVVLSLAIALTASAQAPSLSSEDMPQAGDKYLMSDGNPTNLELADVAATGADQEWTFDLQPTGQQTDTMFGMSDVPLLYNVFLSADYADNTAPDINFPIPGFEFSVTDIYNFYNRTGTKLEQLGFGASINGFPTPVFFSGDNDLLYELPLDFGDTYASSTSFNIAVPGIGSWFQTRDRASEVDGWGTLNGPLGNQQVLRVRSEISYVDSISANTPFGEIGFPVPRTEVEYKWLAAGAGVPLLTVTATTLFGGQEQITRVRYRDIPTGIEKELADNQAITLYPQPASKIVTVVNPYANRDGVVLTVRDATGRVVKREAVAHSGLLQCDVHALPPGLYVVTLQAGTDAFSRRLAVTR